MKQNNSTELFGYSWTNIYHSNCPQIANEIKTAARSVFFWGCQLLRLSSANQKVDQSNRKSWAIAELKQIPQFVRTCLVFPFACFCMSGSVVLFHIHTHSSVKPPRPAKQPLAAHRQVRTAQNRLRISHYMKECQ